MKLFVKKVVLKIRTAFFRETNEAIMIERGGRQVEFSKNYYRTRYPDVDGTNVDPFWHFKMFGDSEGRFPNAIEEIRSLVDEEYYLELYPDVLAISVDPAEHFWTYGAYEQRNPNRFFDTAYYVNSNESVMASGMNPLLHYAIWGKSAGLNPSPWFDETYYRAENRDVVSGHPIALWHFLYGGAAENRSPLRQFNSEYYISMYPNVPESGLGAFEHFVRIGAAAGYRPSPEFDEAYYATHFMDGGVPTEEWSAPHHFLKIGLAHNHPVAPVYDRKDFLPSREPIRPTQALTHPPLVIVLTNQHPASAESCIDRLLTAKHSVDYGVTALDSAGANEGLKEKEGVSLFEHNSTQHWTSAVDEVVTANPGRDIVIIDPRCIVGDGWMDQLVGHAYSAMNTGSVTPCSTHHGAQCENPVDAVLSIPGLATSKPAVSDFATVNAGRTLDLPIAGGLCTYIRRDCINDIGQVFEISGAGHANALATINFSTRATAKAWKHRLAGDVLIEIQESESDQTLDKPDDAKTDFILDAGTNLGIRRFETADPAMPFRFAAIANRYRNSELPVILLVSHNLGGGTQRHLNELTAHLYGQAHFLIMEPLYGTSWKSQANRKVIIRPAEDDDKFRLVIDTFDEYEHLVSLLRSCGVTKIHLHHFLYIALDLKRLVDDLHVPFDFTAHDYFSICPYVNLMTPDSLYCGEPDISGCNECISKRMGHGARDIIWWRKSFEWLFQGADNIICPSADVATRLGQYFDTANLRVAHHSALVPAVPETEIKINNVGAGEPLRVAIIGVLAPHKGAYVVAKCANLAKDRDQPIEFHIIGAVQAALPPGSEAALYQTGAYEEKELHGLLHKVKPHVVWFPAQCPETFSYTLSETLATGLPVVVSNLGAFSERVRGRPWSWILDWDTEPEKVLEFFNHIRCEYFLTNSPPPVSGEQKQEPTTFYRDDYLTFRPKVRPIDLRRRSKLSIIAVLQRSPIRHPGVITDAPDACGFIRGLLPLNELAKSGEFDVTIVEPDRVTDYIGDLFFTQRTAIEKADTAKDIITHCRETGMKIVFDIDDDLLGIASDHPEYELYQRQLAGAFQFTTQSDILFVSTETLGKRLQKWNDNIAVIPNALDSDVWNFPEEVPNVSSGTRSDPVRVLYMGSMTHAADLQLLEPAIRRLNEEFGKRFQFSIVGVTASAVRPDWCECMDPPPEVSESYPAFVHWLQSVNKWHIGIAPLVDTKFNGAKSGIKYLDYAALGLAVVCTDIQGYLDVIESEEDGLLVENTEDAWYAALRRLVVDHELREKLQQNAMKKVRGKYELARFVKQRASALKALLRNTGSLTIRRPWLLEEKPQEKPTRESVAEQFLTGRGLEIGALHNPLAVSERVSVKYVDRFTKEKLYEHYPELRPHNLVDVDIVDDGETLSTIPENTQDFVIANHFLEHCGDPIGTLKNLIRVLNSGGVIYAAVPDRRHTFDKNRKCTSLNHLIEDHENGPTGSRREHFEEWVRHVEPEFGRCYESENDIQARIDELDAMDYSIHYHVWEPDDVWNFLSYGVDHLNFSATIECFAELNDEILFVLRKH